MRRCNNITERLTGIALPLLNVTAEWNCVTSAVKCWHCFVLSSCCSSLPQIHHNMCVCLLMSKRQLELSSNDSVAFCCFEITQRVFNISTAKQRFSGNVEIWRVRLVSKSLSTLFLIQTVTNQPSPAEFCHSKLFFFLFLLFLEVIPGQLKSLPRRFFLSFSYLSYRSLHSLVALSNHPIFFFRFVLPRMPEDFSFSSSSTLSYKYVSTDEAIRT